MTSPKITFKGLSDQQVLDSRAKYGRNSFTGKKENGVITALISLVKEPMFILLMATSFIYFISGETENGFFMVFAIVLVGAISFYQDARSRNALTQLKELTQPKSKVIRNSIVVEIKSEEIVIGDHIIVEEGTLVPADATILQSNDFFVNESILTGESFTVAKNETENNNIFQGTNITGGLAICVVTAIGNNTSLGKIGKSLEAIKEEKTPLQIQISDFVKKMAIAGIIIFCIVLAINYWESKNISDSLIKSLTLAMSILPEEIPVAFTTFMALGAWRLMKMGIIVKQTKTVETLGSATVICTDKTGTITENKMTLAKIFSFKTGNTVAPEDIKDAEEKELIRYAMFASEPIPFDPMEVALHNNYGTLFPQDERVQFKMIHEYPLSGKPPMMTHIFESESGERIIAAKGAAESILQNSTLNQVEKSKIITIIAELSKEGFRVLGVGNVESHEGEFPKTQQEFNLQFLGLVAFYDPPKHNIKNVLRSFYEAGIAVKILTGDNALTTATIAKQVEFQGLEKTLSGDELMEMNDEELKERVLDTNIFTRMFPEAKLRIINALKSKGQIVAMTGDGVNDGPALKASHIGIAMGKKGSEIAKQASTLILVNDDLANMVDAIAMGRKIYNNLKKAIQYIISIHIPIILTVFVPLALGWVYPAIFTPVHIIFFELIMGPTCSIIYENEPIEKNLMQQKPRQMAKTFFNWRELTTSIWQGLVITIGTLSSYQIAINMGLEEDATRTMVFLTLITSNIVLTLVNRSFYFSIFSTLKYKNKLIPIIIVSTITLTTSLLIIPQFSNFFLFAPLTLLQLTISIFIGAVCVFWFELVKWNKRKKRENYLM